MTKHRFPTRCFRTSYIKRIGFVRSTAQAGLALSMLLATSIAESQDLSTGRGQDADPKASSPMELIQIASLDFEGGHEIRFTVNAVEDEISIVESAPIDHPEASPLLLQEEFKDLDPLELYISLTPEDRAVPRALFDLSDSYQARALAEYRTLVESTPAAPALFATPLSKVSTQESSGPMASLCGSNGKSEFLSLCNTLDSQVAFSYCAEGKHTWHQRTTDGKYKQSHGFTVSCNSSVQTRHWRLFGGIWHEKSFHSNAHGYWHYTKVYNTDLKYRRRVRMDRYLPTSSSTSVSYIRSWIGFK